MQSSRYLSLLLLAGCASPSVTGSWEPGKRLAELAHDVQEGGEQEAPGDGAEGDPPPPAVDDSAEGQGESRAAVLPSEQQADWGIAALVRTAGIPYESENDSVSSFIPMMFYEGENFFLRGLSGGAHLWTDEETGMELNALTRLRFFDIPAEFQNQVQGDTFDFGLQLRRELDDAWVLGEVMTDDRGNWHLNTGIGMALAWEDWVVLPSLNLRYGSSDYVSRYYAIEPFTGQSADGDIIVSPEVTARYHVISDFYLLGSLRYNMYGDEIRGLDIMDDVGNTEALLGFGFFQNAGEPQFLGHPGSRDASGRDIDLSPYLRLAQGWSTPSSLGDILSGDIEDPDHDNTMTSFFYGHPLTDELFGVPFDIYFSPGVAYHWYSEVQDPTYELIAKIHLYYTVEWPIRWRLGAAEGISWIEDVTYQEGKNMARKGYEESQLMNYLDFTLDFNMGDLFGAKSMERLWLGASIHHRSSIFESASQFGRIKGGSNYPSIYLQWDLY